MNERKRQTDEGLALAESQLLDVGVAVAELIEANKIMAARIDDLETWAKGVDARHRETTIALERRIAVLEERLQKAQIR